jgi:hypothetical protein
MPFYDDRYDSYGTPWPGEPGLADTGLTDRVTHLVFVDGRLVDHWTEPASGSRWQPYAERFDRERRPPAPPPTPLHEQALRWLDGVCGGRDAVLSLDADPLTDDGRDLPDTGSRQEQELLAETWRLLERTSERYFDGEVALALRAALLIGRERESRGGPEQVPAHWAGGLLWLVGKANALLYPASAVTQRALQDHLGVGTSLSTLGQQVQRAIVGWWATDPLAARPWTAPDVLPTGRPELLTSGTRERLVRLRDEALAAQKSSAA